MLLQSAEHEETSSWQNTKKQAFCRTRGGELWAEDEEASSQLNTWKQAICWTRGDGLSADYEEVVYLQNTRRRSLRAWHHTKCFRSIFHYQYICSMHAVMLCSLISPSFYPQALSSSSLPINPLLQIRVALTTQVKDSTSNITPSLPYQSNPTGNVGIFRALWPMYKAFPTLKRPGKLSRVFAEMYKRRCENIWHHFPHSGH